MRSRQRDEMNGRLIGVGFGCYIEMTALQTSAAARAKARCHTDEQALFDFTPTVVEIGVGVQNHGQGMETTLAQVAYERFGMDVAMVAYAMGILLHHPTRLAPMRRGR